MRLHGGACFITNQKTYPPPRRAGRRRTISHTEKRSDSGNREYPYRPRSRRAGLRGTCGDTTGGFLFWGSLKPCFLFRKRKRKGGFRNRCPRRAGRHGDAQYRARRNAATAETGNTRIDMARRAGHSGTDRGAAGFSFLWKSENGSFLFPKRKELVSGTPPAGLTPRYTPQRRIPPFRRSAPHTTPAIRRRP